MNKRGMTLLEVIIAALILAVTVGGVLFIFSNEKGVVARTGRQIQALDFGQQTLEELKNEVDANVWPAGGLVETDADWSGDTAGDWTAWGALTGDLETKFKGEGRRYRVRNIDGDPTYDSDGVGGTADDIDYKQVEVVVDWDEPAPVPQE